MRIAITGGTGLVGRHVARALAVEGHELALVSRGHDRTDPGIQQLPRTRFDFGGLRDVDKVAHTFAGCEAVVHCAGINRELGDQTYRRVHIEGTRHVIEAARQAGARKIVLISFLRARPGCDTPYSQAPCAWIR